ncbi:uncharacterized protein LOC135168740 isoform X4 [Diachasmimorpha longicaudata]|uniref:uncharacterized protein LOC135168740 isoform X4 n=1 Tax=Diachasmimorpha longicaudata TaxID=58733 RepID=UPI0030B88923
MGWRASREYISEMLARTHAVCAPRPNKMLWRGRSVAVVRRAPGVQGRENGSRLSFPLRMYVCVLHGEPSSPPTTIALHLVPPRGVSKKYFSSLSVHGSRQFSSTDSFFFHSPSPLHGNCSNFVASLPVGMMPTMDSVSHIGEGPCASISSPKPREE